MPELDPLALVVNRLAISDLVHAYCQGVDRLDPDAVARLFTEDGTFVAYHVLGDEGAETLMIWHIRYLDTYVRSAEGWRIGERVLRVDMVSNQPLDGSY